MQRREVRREEGGDVRGERRLQAETPDPSAPRHDANDAAQFGELETLGELTKIAWEHDVQVMHSDTNRGIEVLLNPIYNKGTGFSIAEKDSHTRGK